jgi:hypothetical protein
MSKFVRSWRWGSLLVPFEGNPFEDGHFDVITSWLAYLEVWEWYSPNLTILVSHTIIL